MDYLLCVSSDECVAGHNKRITHKNCHMISCDSQVLKVVGSIILRMSGLLCRLQFELCRYYQIQYTASNNSVVENPVYSLTIDSLEHSNSVYRVEIIALLNSSSSRGGKTSEIFQTYLDLTGMLLQVT